jgi:hypothetical protein
MGGGEMVSGGRVGRVAQPARKIAAPKIIVIDLNTCPFCGMEKQTQVVLIQS